MYNDVCFETMHSVICLWTYSILLSHLKFDESVCNPSRTEMQNEAHELLPADVHTVSLLLVMGQSESTSRTVPLHTSLQLTVHSDTVKWVMRSRRTFVFRHHEIFHLITCFTCLLTWRQQSGASHVT